MAKRKVTTVDEERVKEAKKKVNDLLKGTGFEEPDEIKDEKKNEEEMVSPVSDTDKQSQWLNQQVNGLTEEVEKLEKMVIDLQNQNNLLRSGGNQYDSMNSENISDKNKIIELYQHFESIYNGRNRYGKPFSTVVFSNPQHGNGVLDMFIKAFPFLGQYIQYKHWG